MLRGPHGSHTLLPALGLPDRPSLSSKSSLFRIGILATTMRKCEGRDSCEMTKIFVGRTRIMVRQNLESKTSVVCSHYRICHETGHHDSQRCALALEER